MDLIKDLQQAYRLLNNGDLNSASQIIIKAQQAQPSHPKVWQLSALLHKSKGEDQAAIECLMRAISLSPNDAELHNSLANLLQLKSHWEQAIESYETAIKLKPDYKEARINLALCHKSKGDFDASSKVLESVLKHQPKDANAKQLLANLRRDQDLYESAERLYSELTDSLKTDAKFWYHRGLNAQKHGDLSMADSCFDKSMSINPQFVPAVVANASVCLERGQAEVAIASLQDFIVHNPRSVEAHKSLDRILWEQGRGAEVGQSLQHATERAADETPLAIAYIEQLIHVGQIEKAYEKVSTLIAGNLVSPQMLALRGKTLALLCRPNEAINDFTASLNSDFQVDVASDLIQLSLIQQQYDLAQQNLDHLKDAKQDTQLAWALQAVLWRQTADDRYHWLVRYEEFLRTFEMATPKGFDSLSDFLVSLEKELLGLHVTHYEPLEQTLKNGSQTAPKLFQRDIVEVQQLRECCREIVDQYLASFKFEEGHPFLSRLSDKFRFSGSWSVRLFDQGYHVNHVHPQGWISSSSYISLPDLVASNSQGFIQFGQSSMLLKENDDIEKMIKPTPGMVVLFPSYFWHGTVPFTSEQNQHRLTAPFDVLPI